MVVSRMVGPRSRTASPVPAPAAPAAPRVPTAGGRSRRTARSLALAVPAAVVLGMALPGTAAALPVLPLPKPALVKGTPCTVAAAACVDLDEEKAWLISKGSVTLGPVDISAGDADRPTPTGDFRVLWKDLHHISGESLEDPDGPSPMPYSVFFAPGGIAFHEGGTDSPSGGCIHLERENAQKFFQTLGIGAVVQVRDRK